MKVIHCPCGTNKNYAICCGRYLDGTELPPDAESLMRSRYTAFTQANVDYLLRSHAVKTRPVKDRKNIERWAKSVIWMGLSILQTEAGEATDETGYVEFKATFLENGQPGQIHERSLFNRENGKWVYVSGVHF